MFYKLHGGDVYHEKISLDFSVNLNPLGLPPGVKQALRDSLEHWSRYPDPESRELTKRLAQRHKIESSRIVWGNGAADLLYRLIYEKRPRQALLPAPTFSEYEQALKAVGCRIRYWNLKEEQDYRVEAEDLARDLKEGEMLFLCNPNNPTGLAVLADQVELLAAACQKKKGFLVLDECFCEFLDNPRDYTFMEKLWKYPEVAILRAFTKSYAMAGLRLGYLLCGDPGLAERIRHTGQPWSVSLPAQEAGAAALEEGDYLEQARRLVREERQWMERGLKDLGFLVFPSQVNYLLFKDFQEEQQGNLWEYLRKRGILIRDCHNFRGLKREGDPEGVHYYRIGIRTREENERLMEEIRTRPLNNRERNGAL